MKTGFKRFLCGVVAAMTLMGMGAVAFAAENPASEADDAAIEAVEDSTDEAVADDATATEAEAADDSAAVAAETISNPSTGVDSTMLPISVMGVFLVLAGGVAAISAKRRASEQ